MNKRIRLYGLLLVVTLIQIVCMKHTSFFPDLMLLMVVFMGIFQGHVEGIKFGFLAGFLRGTLSVYTLPVDIFLFPMIGALSAIMAERAYRQNPVVEIIITTISVFIVVFFHAFCLKIVSANEFVGAWGVFTGSFRALIVTIALSPPFFFFLRGMTAQEE